LDNFSTAIVTITKAYDVAGSRVLGVFFICTLRGRSAAHQTTQYFILYQHFSNQQPDSKGSMRVKWKNLIATEKLRHRGKF
jgi:hypothetical protein